MLDIGYSPWPSYSEQDILAVSKMLTTGKVNYWTGQECRLFEKEFADWVGVTRAVAVSNGTVALDLALKAIGVGDGDEVIVTPRTFIATVSCIVNSGAIPIFADVDPCSGNITERSISKVLTDKTRAIVCVHLAGWPCDMDPIINLARSHNIKVIEDCAQAHGALYKGRSVGSIGDIGVWSFCQDKIMTTGGEGGMVTTSNDRYWDKIWSYKDHGKCWESVYEVSHEPGFRWVHDSFGTNWRMLEFQAVLGRRQLCEMPEWGRLRERNANLLRASLGKYRFISQPEFKCSHSCELTCSKIKKCRHAYYKYYAYLNLKKLPSGWNRDIVIRELNEAGVPCYYGSCSEVYLEKAFDATVYRPKERLKVAKDLGETSLMFLVHPNLTVAEMTRICDGIDVALQKCV